VKRISFHKKYAAAQFETSTHSQHLRDFYGGTVFTFYVLALWHHQAERLLVYSFLSIWPSQFLLCS